MTGTKPKRRWFRFSLRTLFVLVSIACITAGWAAYQLNWIRQRHQFLKRPVGTYGFDGMIVDAECPWSLKLFGEKACDAVFTNKATKQEAKELFPEARIVVIDAFDGDPEPSPAAETSVDK
jgi:hypothetical protein